MKMRTCGICGVENIPRGVDWPTWIGGRPVCFGCKPVYPEVKEKMKFIIDFEYKKPDNVKDDDYFPSYISGKVVVEAETFAGAEMHFTDMEKEIGSLAGLSVRLLSISAINE